MGAAARILLNMPRAQDARGIIDLVEAEIERLETILSLFRSDSQLCRLNREGYLAQPSSDLRRALGLGLGISRLTDGLFDPTVQALWEAHVDWFRDQDHTTLPPDGVIASARRLVNWRKVQVAPDVIRLGEGQRITLNGLGQGYVTDRVAELLVGRGLTNVLVDLGEQRALGPRPDHSPWLIARRDAASIALSRGALATSEGSGCVLGARGAAHHLFDPRSGRSAQQWQTITVHHDSAAVADALSTAFSVASADELQRLQPRVGRPAIWATDLTGRHHHWPASNPENIAG
ncbi:FAD:protein FMN transferase [Bradyrhizobium oligotrophicum]|nr:FAD:protein FMN transferase [Bradyrhizobium oligotrophicum]